MGCSGGGGTGKQGNGWLRARVRAGNSTARPGHEHTRGGWCGGSARLLVAHDKGGSRQGTWAQLLVAHG